MTIRFTVLSLVLVLVLVLNHCDGRWRRPAATLDRSTAATVLTERYAQSRFAPWHVLAMPAGTDCAVLCIRTSVILEPAMIEAMHYGAGPYDVIDGGVRQFYPERSFRGVVYIDSTGRSWPYGAVTVREAETLTPCR
jgi:hypothetical protein